MSILNQKLGLLDQRISDILINTGIAFGTAKVLKTDVPSDVMTIVAIDTVFRIGISVVLSAIRMPSRSNSDAIRLLCLCLPIATQPLSAVVARKWFRMQTAPNYISTLGYLTFSWRGNALFRMLTES